MGACMSETTVKLTENGEAVRPKAQIRQTSHTLVVKDNAVNGTVA